MKDQDLQVAVNIIDLKDGYKLLRSEEGIWAIKGNGSAAIVTDDREAVQLLLEEYERTKKARSIDDWHEDIGSVLWWKFPIEEPPYCGTPLDSHWPDYHTHWTPIICPEPPE